MSRSLFRFVCGSLATFLLSACAIHPLPSDVTGLSTYQITRQITCETREAVVETIIGFLTDPANQTIFPTPNPKKAFQRVDAESYAVGLRLKRDPTTLSAKHLTHELTGTAKAIIDIIVSIGIAYNYDLLMSELNNNDGSVNFISALTRSTISLGIAPKLDLQRQNERLFTSATTFENLIDGPSREICKPAYLVGKNYLYPIAGNIGMKGVIQDFVQQAVFGNLAGDETKDFSKASSPVQSAEQLQFTTLLDLSITPKVTFAPVPLVGAGFHVADASFSGEAQRKDVHKLTIGLYVPLKGSFDGDRNDVSGGLLGLPVGGIVTAPTHHKPAEAGALRVLNQILILNIYNGRQIIVQ